MDDAHERRCLIALHLTPALGAVRIARLVRAFGSAAAACEASDMELAAVPGMSPRVAALAVGWRDRTDVDGELARARACGARVATWCDPDYPAALRDLEDAPPVVYLRGAWSGGPAPAVAVVGTRRASRYGLGIASALGGILGTAGAVVVSGLARGIDRAAHAGALRAGAVTVGVLGCGVDVAYPAEHRSLMEAMRREGAVMAEVPLGSAPRVQQFPRRNRLISGLARAVVVVEGDVDSGAMITARFAMAQGRQVFAVPGSVYTRSSRGPHWLLAQGARILGQPDDLLAALGLAKVPRPSAAAGTGGTGTGGPRSAAVPPDGAPVAAGRGKADPAVRILAILDESGVHIDAIAARTGLSAAEAARTLSALVVRGLARQLPGQHYAQRPVSGTLQDDVGGSAWPNHS